MSDGSLLASGRQKARRASRAGGGRRLGGGAHACARHCVSNKQSSSHTARVRLCRQSDSARTRSCVHLCEAHCVRECERERERERERGRRRANTDRLARASTQSPRREKRTNGNLLMRAAREKQNRTFCTTTTRQHKQIQRERRSSTTTNWRMVKLELASTTTTRRKKVFEKSSFPHTHIVFASPNLCPLLLSPFAINQNQISRSLLGSHTLWSAC